MDQISRQVVADHGQVPELLGHPRLIRGGGDVPVDDPPAANLQEADEVVGSQPRCGHSGEVTGPDELPVVGEKLQPAQTEAAAPLRGESMLLQDASHAAPAEAHEPQLPHLPGNLAVAHPPVLPGDAQHPLLHLRGDLGGTAWLPPGQQHPVSPHDRPVPAHQRLRLHNQQRILQLLLAQQQAGEHESEPLDGHQRWSLAQLSLQDQHLVVERQHQAGLLAAEHQPEEQVEGREQHQHDIPEHGREDAAVRARSQRRGRPGTESHGLLVASD